MGRFILIFYASVLYRHAIKWLQKRQIANLRKLQKRTWRSSRRQLPSPRHPMLMTMKRRTRGACLMNSLLSNWWGWLLREQYRERGIQSRTEIDDFTSGDYGPRCTLGRCYQSTARQSAQSCRCCSDMGMSARIECAIRRDSTV